MHIKYVTLQGFRSYRDAVKTEQLSPRHNIVVGRNGSGKSNFFNAIQFVLSDEYSRLSPEQRQGFIYEGAGIRRVMSAYVEIIFDNSDKRLPIDKDEVALRRHIGTKKDQFFLDGKMATRNDVMSLLESSGFSRSNPYYIVRQGKINEIATAKDEQRLKLLKEVAGTKVYDERKNEARSLMLESDAKLQNSDELLTMIDDKLKTLEQEKAELVEYQKLDKSKRALEYAIASSDLRDAKKKLDDISKKRTDESSRTAELRDERHTAQQESIALEAQLSEINRTINQLLEEKETCDAERSKIVQRKERLNLKTRDLQRQKNQDLQGQESMQNELEQLQETIENKTNELQTLEPKYDLQVQIEHDTDQNLQSYIQQFDSLNARRGRKSAFVNQAQRDEYLRQEINKVDKEIQRKKTDIANCNYEIAKSEKTIEEIKSSFDQISHEKMQCQNSWETEHSELTEHKKGREVFHAKKHEVVRQSANKQSQIDSFKSQQQGKMHRLNQLMGKGTTNAISSFAKIKEIFRQKGRRDLVEGFYGMAIDFIVVPEEFMTCTEAAIGGKLFQFIMKSNKVAKAYIAEMNRLNLPGSPNILPLNVINSRPIDYPEVTDERGEPTAFPLLERIDITNEELRPILRHLLGRYMVTVDSTWSDRISREYNLSCVTLDGDTTSSRGVITGGYRDTTRSKLKLYTEIHRTDGETLKRLEKDHESLRQERKSLEQQATELMDLINNKEAAVARYRQQISRLAKQEEMLKRDRSNREKAHNSSKHTITKLNDTLRMMVRQKENFENEMVQPFSTHEGSQNLTQRETEEIEQLEEKISASKDELNKIRDIRMELERQKNDMENLLYNQLHKRRDQLINDTDDISLVERQQMLATAEADLETASRELEYVEKRLNSLTNELETTKDEASKLQSRYDECVNKEKECSSMLDEEQKHIMKLSSKQSTYVQKRDECQRRINEIGPVAQEVVRKYTGMSSKHLYSKLHDCKTQLQKYSNVNKKALDQFLSSSEERRLLTKRRQEIIKGKKAIEEMIDVLEEKKYNQIMFTFQQVSQFFKEVFSKLVNGGHAELLMKKSAEHESNPDSQVDLFTGVSINVAFSGGAETREMNQLSGGQKSLVALTLIFAIQKCDPAPFYLFDEIDAALDPVYRHAVSKMIGQLSNNAQFISTTFRPEMLESGDKFFGVLYKGKVSDVQAIPKSQAEEFVADDAIHG